MSAHLDGLIAMLAAGAGWLAAGVAIGAIHFATLQRNAAMFAAGGPLAVPLLLQLMRLTLTAVLLVAVVRFGHAAALLLAAAGILVARWGVVRRERPT